VKYSPQPLGNYLAPTIRHAGIVAQSAFDHEFASAQDDTALEALRVRWLGRENGIVNKQIADLWLKGAPREAKRDAGQAINRLKKHIEDCLAAGKNFAPGADIKAVDISLPGIRRPIGAEHPVMRASREMCSVFQRLGFSIAEGPVIETDYYNFEALNFPPNHPARDTQDTLFIAGQQSKPQRERLLLRTHTSPVQIRTMEKMRPPIRIVIPGTVHRNDPPDASHSPMFHQIEGLAVDTNITFGDLKGTLDHAMKEFFGSSVKTSFRP
jgi:phenylalanyl-tRNA synthetase alpha chain